uniref:H(+)/Cl(-) exchange transporter 7 n=1 Tax=Cacopsylla melanoneura TaxID=428564 RepID=A0A8D8TQ34_9HEMI
MLLFSQTNYNSLARIIFNVDCTIEYVQKLRQDMIMNVAENDKMKRLDLTPFLNHNVFYITQSVSLYFIYNLFRQMGMRTLYIIDQDEKLVGLVTRKDVARYKQHLHMGRSSLKKIRVPSSSESKSVSPSE